MAEFSISNIEISTPNKKRKKYSLEFKKEIALAAIKTNNLTVARDNDICESNVRLWRKDLPKIEQAIKDSSDEKNSAKKFRIDQGGGGCGKFPVNLELERYLRRKIYGRSLLKRTESQCDSKKSYVNRTTISIGQGRF